MAVIGGALGYKLLTWIAPSEDARDLMDGSAYTNTGKLQVLLGDRFFDEIRGKTVIDFGCGTRAEVVEMARRGARRVLGLDIRSSCLVAARDAAAAAGLADRCVFAAAPDEPADVIVSLDSFEHFDDPAAILRVMDRHLRPDGKVIATFGPPWYHPVGGHLFSVFPWAHIVFTETALLRWRRTFRPRQTARTIAECGLNKMTLRRFERLVANSPFRFERFEARPIRRCRWLTTPLLREFGTSVVICTLVKRASPATLMTAAVAA